MKDIYAIQKNGKFDDIVFNKEVLIVNNKTNKKVIVKVLKTIEKEPKLAQSLMKLLLTNKYDHILNFGVDQLNFSMDEIIQALAFYNEISDSISLEEKIDEIVSITQEDNYFTIVLRTKAGTTTTIGVGV